MKLPDLVHTIRNHLDLGPAFVHHRHIPPVEATFAPEPDFPSEIQGVIRSLGIKELYKHQVEAIGHIREGAHVLVSTPTASGKSLIYNTCVLEVLLKINSPRPSMSFP